LSQHVAPFYCLLAAAGLAALMQRFRPPHRLWLGTLVLASALGLICVVGMVHNLAHPYRDVDSIWARAMQRRVLDQAGNDPVVIAHPHQVVEPIFQWQFGKLGRRVAWIDQVNWATVGRGGSVWVVALTPAADQTAQDTGSAQLFTRLLSADGKPWRCVVDRTERERDAMVNAPKSEKDAIPERSLRLYHLVRG
jgi:hypothetical protein